VKTTKAQNKHLRALSATAHERELSQALGELSAKFQEWQKGDLSPWDLNQEIHEFHDGKQRELYKFYVMQHNPLFCVASALTNGIIDIDEVPENCREILKPKVEIVKNDKDIKLM
jgi:hypothetical protein